MTAVLLGILSDSHGRVDATRRAVDLLQQAGAERLIHLGDIESVAVLDELVGRNASVVFGNCDWDEAGLRSYCDHVDIAVAHPAGRLVADGKTIAFTHGHLGRYVEQALRENVDYLLYGHTHVASDERRGATRMINPGALFRAARYTAALLDPCSDRLEFVEVSKKP